MEPVSTRVVSNNKENRRIYKYKNELFGVVTITITKDGRDHIHVHFIFERLLIIIRGGSLKSELTKQRNKKILKYIFDG